MKAEIRLAAVGRLGWATRFSQIDVLGRTASEVALRVRTRPAGPPHVGAATKRSFPTTSVVDQVLELVPPRPDFRARDAEAIDAAWEAISAFARAPDGVAASYAKSMLRWDAVPECVSSLQHSIAAEFLAITESPAGEVLRWWVSGDGGWVGVGFNGGRVSMVPSSLADIRYALLVDLVGAVSAGSA